MKYFSRWILKIAGWKCLKAVPDIDKSVICVAPHTTNWDFVMGKLFYWSLGDFQASFLMKKEWFVFPISYLFKAMGGVPIIRSKSNSVTDQIAAEFSKHKQFHIAIAPEGTRGYVEEWKKGFYYIAQKANVPIQLAYIDYEKKEMGITEIFHPTGDADTDIRKIRTFYVGKKGLFPHKFHNINT